MKSLIALALLVAGLVLMIYGINASESLGSDISRFFTGAPTDKAVWMLIGGFAAIIAGLAGFVFKPRR